MSDALVVEAGPKTRGFDDAYAWWDQEQRARVQGLFIESRLEQLEERRQKEAPELSFDEYLRHLGVETSQGYFWDGRDTQMWDSLFGPRGGVYRFVRAMNDALEARGSRMYLTGNDGLKFYAQR